LFINYLFLNVIVFIVNLSLLTYTSNVNKDKSYKAKALTFKAKVRPLKARPKLSQYTIFSQALFL